MNWTVCGHIVLELVSMGCTTFLLKVIEDEVTSLTHKMLELALDIVIVDYGIASLCRICIKACTVGVNVDSEQHRNAASNHRLFRKGVQRGCKKIV
jgi:hypothetical protein